MCVKEDPVETRERRGGGLTCKVPCDDRYEPFSQTLGKIDLVLADWRDGRLRTQNEDDCVRFGDQLLDSLPPFFALLNILAIHSGVDRVSLQHSFEAVNKVQ